MTKKEALVELERLEEKADEIERTVFKISGSIEILGCFIRDEIPPKEIIQRENPYTGKPA